MQIRTYRDHQPAADFKLVFERFGNRRAAGGDNDRVIGRVRRPAARAIAMQNVDVAVAKIGHRRGGLLGQRTMTLDGVDLGGDFGKNRRRIA